MFQKRRLLQENWSACARITAPPVDYSLIPEDFVQRQSQNPIHFHRVHWGGENAAFIVFMRKQELQREADFIDVASLNSSYAVCCLRFLDCNIMN